jgi:hypothetical protein
VCSSDLPLIGPAGRRLKAASAQIHPFTINKLATSPGSFTITRSDSLGRRAMMATSRPTRRHTLLPHTLIGVVCRHGWLSIGLRGYGQSQRGQQ